MDKRSSSRLTSAVSPRTGESAPSEVRIDPAASAALAEAIRSAREQAKPESPAQPLEETKVSAAPRGRLSQGTLLIQAAMALLFLATGWSASYVGTLSTQETLHRMEAETARNQILLGKLTDELSALKGAMAARDVEHTASIAIPGQAELAQKIDRLAAAIQDPGKKLTALDERLTRMEGQIMAGLNNLSAAKPAAAAPPAQDNEASAKPVKAEPVDGWVLREVYNGSALVESRNRGLYEVMPGSTIPGVGRVETIERRGARWVVVTDKGFIGTYR